MERFILIAEQGELPLLEQVRDKMGLKDEWKEAPIIYTGVGGINIIRALQGLPRQAEVLNIGYAGSANFDIGSWIAVSEVRLNHPNVTYPEPELHLDSVPITAKDVREAVCYTNCDFVLVSDYKDCVFDMELAFIASLGFAKTYSLKYVSDNLSLHDYHERTHGVE